MVLGVILIYSIDTIPSPQTSLCNTSFSLAPGSFIPFRYHILSELLQLLLPTPKNPLTELSSVIYITFSPLTMPHP